MLTLFTGWILTNGTHAVTQALVVTSVSGQRHHEAYHRFFSRGTWEPDAFGKCLYTLIVKLLPEGAPLRVAIDDTLAPKKGAHVFGIGSHIDAVHSTRLRKVFCFGHCWVVLAVLVQVPFAKSPWALPILFRLYRNQKVCLRKKQAYRKKTELARELIDVLLGWAEGRRIEVAADSAYCCGTVTHKLSSTVVLFGAMRPDAVLTTLPAASGSKGGRPRKRGDVLPKPQVLAKDETHPWQTCEAKLYGATKTTHYKDYVAQWYRACGTQLLRIVTVRVDHGAINLRVYFCTDATLSVREILEGYAARWGIEVCFRNLKQMLGFADSSARKKEAVERTAPFVGFIYTLIVLWFIQQQARKHSIVILPIRPWYRHKEGFSFADVLRTVQRVLAPLDVLDPPRDINNLHDTCQPAPEAPQECLARAA
jgi:hypothetical protein